MNKTIIQHILLLLTLLVWGVGVVCAENPVSQTPVAPVQETTATDAVSQSTNICGDANCDQSVDISDVVSVINHIHGSTPSPFSTTAADANSDGDIDISDVVTIINIIHYGTIEATSTINDWVEGNTEGELQEQEIYAD